MAMTTCAECKASVSDKAKSCPGCGAAVEKKHSKLQWLIIGAATIGMVSCIATQQSAQDEKAAAVAAAEAQKTPEQRAAEAAAKVKKEAEFQRIVAGAKSIKQQSKNPDSFKLKGAIVTSAGAACYEFQGTNSFNAIVPGTVVEVGGKFLTTDAAWNKHCAGKTGNSYLHASTAI